ncbi:lantibiotic dehydratase [Nonomuraea ferruginea]
MRGRATPFGIFARRGACAVRRDGPGLLAREPRGSCPRGRGLAGRGHRPRLERCSTLRRRQRVEMNDFAVARGDRLVVGWQPHASMMSDGPAPQVSVRYGTVVRAIVQAARST